MGQRDRWADKTYSQMGKTCIWSLLGQGWPHSNSNVTKDSVKHLSKSNKRPRDL